MVSARRRALLAATLELAALALVAWNVVVLYRGLRGDWQWNTEDDVRQSLFVLHSFSEPALFANDPLADFARAFLPPGALALGWLLSLTFDVVVAARLTAIATTTVCLALAPWCVARCFRWRSPPFWLALVLLTANPYIWRVARTGLTRGFVIPLSLLVLVAFLRRGVLLFAIAVLLAALLSPTLLVFLAVLAPFKLLHEEGVPRSRAALRALLAPALSLAVAFALAGALVLPWRHTVTEALGPVGKWSALASDPAFLEGGRWHHERIRPMALDLWWLGGESIPLPKAGRLLLYPLLVLAALGCLLFRGRTQAQGESEARVLRATGAFVLAALTCWLAARGLALSLYFPNRYYIPAMVPVLLGSIALVGLAGKWLCARWPSTLGSPIGRRSLTILGCALAALAVWHGGHRDYSERTTFLLHREGERRELIEFLRDRLPADAVIAGNPWLMDDVPLFARKSVWVNYEVMLPLYPRHYRLVVERTRQLIPAYFAWDAGAATTFAAATPVTHMVYCRDDFEGPGPPWSRRDGGAKKLYIEPFRAELAARLAARPGDRPWLWQAVAREDVVFESRSYVVIRLRRASG